MRYMSRVGYASRPCATAWSRSRYLCLAASHNGDSRFCPMKILVLPKPREDVPLEARQQHVGEEIQAVWDLYAQGIVREFYTRAGQPGRVVLILECETVEVAKEALATLPFARLGMIDFDLTPLAPFTGLSRLFEAAS